MRGNINQRQRKLEIVSLSRGKSPWNETRKTRNSPAIEILKWSASDSKTYFITAPTSAQVANIEFFAMQFNQIFPIISICKECLQTTKTQHLKPHCTSELLHWASPTVWLWHSHYTQSNISPLISLLTVWNQHAEVTPPLWKNMLISKTS